METGSDPVQAFLRRAQTMQEPTTSADAVVFLTASEYAELLSSLNALVDALDELADLIPPDQRAELEKPLQEARL
jgi:hypothetical protein